MNKICIVSSDSLFAGDLAQQILREVPETEILSADSVQNADMLLLDAESGETASCAGQKADSCGSLLIGARIVRLCRCGDKKTVCPFRVFAGLAEQNPSA